MTALKIILGIILFIILVLSVKVKVTVHSEDGIRLTVGWLFLKFQILPLKPKKKKKPKKEKKKKEKPEEKDEKVPEPKTKKENMFVTFYHNNGVSGIIDLLQRLKAALSGMFHRIGRAFLFENIYISILVSAGDCADTAVKYGKICSAVYPAAGYFVDTMRVKKYSIDVNPDFIHGVDKARLHTKFSVRPIRLINAVVIVAFQLLFKVLVKFLKGAQVQKEPAQKEEE